jgi:hypothetical protein
MRLYLPDINFTGPNQIIYPGIPDNTGANNRRLNTDNINPKFNVRSTIINFEVPVGLNTPDNIASILTEQMHEPTRFDRNSITRFFDYGRFLMNSVDINDNNIKIRPPLVSTPTYTPMPVNASCQVGRIEGNIYEDFQGCRQLYYRNVAYAFPERLALNVFNTAIYGIDNNQVFNQMNSGNDQTPGIGDFSNQHIGDLGLGARYIDNIAGSGAFQDCLNNHPETTGPLVLTNMYFTELNISRLADAFRTAEKYVGTQTLTYDNKDPNFLSNLAVPIDIGRYIDEVSNGFPLTTSTQPTLSENVPNQRNRFFGSRNEYGPAFGQPGFLNRTTIYTPVDEGNGQPAAGQPMNNNVCIGTQIFGFEQNLQQLNNNDGQMLSQFVFQSRFSEDLVFDENNIADYFQGQYDRLQAQTIPNAFKISAGATIQQTYRSAYTDTQNNTTFKYEDLIALSRKFDIAAIPVFPSTNDEFLKFGGRPYIAFKQHFRLNASPLFNPAVMGKAQVFQIDKRNCPYGIHIGFDPSFIRNPASLLYNTNYAATSLLDDLDSYNKILMMGAVNPSFEFDADLSRFSIKGLNTPTTIGNGLPTNNQDNLDATNDPETQCYNVNKAGQIADIKQFNRATPITLSGITFGVSPVNRMNEFIQQEASQFIDSYTGLAIQSIILYNSKGQTTTLTGNNLYGQDYSQNTGIEGSNTYSQDILYKTLLDKMGFKISQLLPEFGSSQANYTNPLVFVEKDKTFLDKFQDTCRPMTTAAFISSAEYQPTQTNRLDMPLYANGTNIGLVSQPAVDQAELTAQNLPSKLDYPYLIVYSSIIQGGTDTEYYGGADGKSKLPAIGYITRNYNQGDFFYGLEQSFNYTANKTFTLTEISHEVRLPDGSRPRLQPNNSIIYKITKPIAQPETPDTQNNISSNYNKENNERIRKRKEES